MIEPLLVLLLFVVVLDVVGFVVVLVVVLDIGLVHEHPTTDNNKLKIALIFINLFIDWLLFLYITIILLLILFYAIIKYIKSVFIEELNWAYYMDLMVLCAIIIMKKFVLVHKKKGALR